MAGLTPIARWNVVPYQRVETATPFNCGVVAFSKLGIEKVTFVLAGQGYTGDASVDVTKMTYNPRTGTYEYWFPIDASDFATNGAITVEATVTGLDAGVRDKTTDGGGVGLDALPLVVDATGTLAQPEAWVSVTGGSDATGTVDNSALPFATIGAAMGAVCAVADGGIVRLNVGDHIFKQGGTTAVTTTTEWMTIAAASGGTVADTRIVSQQSMPTIALLRCDGIGLCGQQIIKGWGGQFWADSCSLIGQTGATEPEPVYNGGPNWYTDCYITAVRFATPNACFARGLTIENITADAFNNCPMVVNCTADELNPGSTGAHSDAWQWQNSTPTNVILHNFVVRNCHYQTFFVRSQGEDDVPPWGDFHCVAFVNCYFDICNPLIYPGNGGGAWRISGDHLLWWHVTVHSRAVSEGNATGEAEIGLYNDTFADLTSDPQSITNFSVIGCYFDRVWHKYTTGVVDFSEWDRNHYAHPDPGPWGSGLAFPVWPGTNYTTGPNLLDTAGELIPNTCLWERIAPLLVPVDARNTLRTPPADIGPFESSTSCGGAAIVSAVSRKTHGETPRDTDLTAPLSGKTYPVECRVGGPTTIIVTFSGNILPASPALNAVSITAAVQVGANPPAITSIVPATLSITDAILTITLTGVPDKSEVSVSFPGLTDADSDPLGEENTLLFRSRIGDANGDDCVDMFDMVLLRNNLDATVDGDTFRCDFNADDAIDMFDQVLARIHMD